MHISCHFITNDYNFTLPTTEEVVHALQTEWKKAKEARNKVKEQ
jgi:hypothetical protein